MFYSKHLLFNIWESWKCNEERGKYMLAALTWAAKAILGWEVAQLNGDWTIFPPFVKQAQNDKLIPSSRMRQAWPLPGLVNLSIHVWRKRCKNKNQSTFVACMPPLCDWYFVREPRESMRPHRVSQLGAEWGWGLKCAVRRSQGHPPCQSSAEMLLKSNVALKAQSPLSFLCQDGQSGSQARSTQHPRWDLNGFKSAAWGHLGFPGVRMGLEYGMWGRWHIWKLNVPSCHSLCATSFLLLMGQEGLVCCGGSAAKTSAALISLPVLLCSTSS